MTISAVGYYVNAARVYDLTPFAGGGTVPAADGDWIFWFVYYPNAQTVAFHDPTGWTQVRKTVGALATIELWRYHWATGDPTSWTIDMTGRNFMDPEIAFVVVFRDLVTTPGPVSTTHETSSSPVLVDAITDASIGNNDLALVFAASNNGTLPVPVAPENNVSTGYPNGATAAWWRTGTAGAATSRSLTATGGLSEAFGLQLILPDVSLGGWGVGQIRMGAN